MLMILGNDSLSTRPYVRAPMKQAIVSGKIPSPSMRQFTVTRFSLVRAMVVVGALLSLCVSSNVGPCFLPLPALESYTAEILQQTPGTTASRSHSNGSAGFRVPIAQAQKRADESQAQPVAAMPRVHFVLPDDTRVFADLSHPDTYFGSALASLPSGRAPPRLI